MQKRLQVSIPGAAGSWLRCCSQALGKAMLDPLVFDASCYLCARCRLQEFALKGIQWCRPLQREGCGEKQRRCGCGCCWSWRGSAIREQELSRAAETVSPNLGADLLVYAGFVCALRSCWLRSEMLMTCLDGC